MELAKLHLRLSSDPLNTVMIQDCTPAQLAMYIAMHGDDCVQSLTLTGEASRPSEDEIDRLRTLFDTKDAAKHLAMIFPGHAPSMPKRFKSIGYDPAVLGEEQAAVRAAPDPEDDEDAGAEVVKRIAKAAQAEPPKPNKAKGKVTVQPEDDDIDDEDDSASDDEGGTPLPAAGGADLLEKEMARNKAQKKAG